MFSPHDAEIYPDTQDGVVSDRDAQSFKPGDVVHLRSGGAAMTVSRIEPITRELPSAIEVVGMRVHCAWIGGDGILSRDTFKAEMLTKSDDQPFELSDMRKQRDYYREIVDRTNRLNRTPLDEDKIVREAVAKVREIIGEKEAASEDELLSVLVGYQFAIEAPATNYLTMTSHIALVIIKHIRRMGFAIIKTGDLVGPSGYGNDPDMGQ